MNRTGLLSLLFHAYSSPFSLARTRARLFLVRQFSIFRQLPVRRHLFGKNLKTHTHRHTHHLTAKSLSKCFLILSVQTHLHFLWWRRKEWLCYFARQRGNTLAPQELCPHLHFFKCSLLIFINNSNKHIY